jgi:hypothetical protein
MNGKDTILKRCYIIGKKNITKDKKELLNRILEVIESGYDYFYIKFKKSIFNKTRMCFSNWGA